VTPKTTTSVSKVICPTKCNLAK